MAIFNIHTVPVKCLDTPSHSMFYLYLYIFYIGDLWNYVVKTKSVKIPDYVLHFSFFKVSAIYFDDSFAHSCSLNQLHEFGVSWTTERRQRKKVKKCSAPLGIPDCWKTIPGDYLTKLIESMPRLCKDVMKQKVATLKNPC